LRALRRPSDCEPVTARSAPSRALAPAESQAVGAVVERRAVPIPKRSIGDEGDLELETGGGVFRPSANGSWGPGHRADGPRHTRGDAGRSAAGVQGFPMGCARGRRRPARQPLPRCPVAGLDVEPARPRSAVRQRLRAAGGAWAAGLSRSHRFMERRPGRKACIEHPRLPTEAPICRTKEGSPSSRQCANVKSASRGVIKPLGGGPRSGYSEKYVPCAERCRRWFEGRNEVTRNEQ
jgi:hypothetical protein